MKGNLDMTGSKDNLDITDSVKVLMELSKNHSVVARETAAFVLNLVTNEQPAKSFENIVNMVEELCNQVDNLKRVNDLQAEWLNDAESVLTEKGIPMPEMPKARGE